MVKCKNCGREVEPHREFSMFWFVVFILLFFPLAIMQIIIAPKTKCPACGKKVY
ncbi:MAG: hypothetical protein N4A47_03360 [Clostridia bacterium]|jgi:uncharacterized OB-fold protein|nr:hypothetical protein [Clostridia bacterium]